MFCENCGTELADDATFCSNCGNRVRANRKKNIYIALVLTFIITGLGSIYAGNVKKGLILLAARLLFALLGGFLSIFLVFSLLVWAYAFYEAYKDIQIANGHANPKLLDDFKGWDQNRKIIAILIAVIILFVIAVGSISVFVVENYTPSNSNTHYYDVGSGSSSGSYSHSSHSSHYGGVDDSPRTIARNDPDWYYDHYEYGDNPDIDDYLESEGYD